MGESLSWKQFVDLMNIIEKGHRFARGGKHIKYVTPHLDMRDRKVFSVKYRGMFKEGELTFDFRDSDEPMFDRIKQWLEG